MHIRSPLSLGIATTIGFLGVFSLIFSSGCSKQESTSPYIPSVKVFEVSKEATGQARRLSGKVHAAKRSALSFGIAGKVLEVIPVEGMEVVKGQLLASLDDETLQRRVEDAQSKLISSRTDWSEAKSSYERIERLFQQRGASEKDRQSALSSLASAESRLKSAQNDLENAISDLSSAKLVAPFSGRIEAVLVDPFEEVAAGTEIIRLQADDVLEIRVRVPETLIRHVNYGDIVDVSFASLADTKLSGSVTSIAAEAVEGNAFPVTVRLSPSELDIRPGMTASATFNFNRYLDGKTVYLIPMSAIAIDTGLQKADTYSREQDGKFSVAPVFVLDVANGILQERQVSVGLLRDNEVEIYDGLERGDLVVVAGVPFLHDKMPATRWTGPESNQAK